MKPIQLLFVLSLSAILIISISSFTHKSFEQVAHRRQDPGYQLFVGHCSACHLLPDPASLPKHIWEFGVLPVMASRMGIAYPLYDPLKGLTDKEKKIVARNHVFPSQPLLSEADWKLLSDYIIRNAPEQIDIDLGRLTRNAPLKQFVRSDVVLSDTVSVSSMITGLKYNASTQTLWIADAYQNVFNWQWHKGIIGQWKSQSPVVDFTFYQDQTYLTQIGEIFPTELSKGSYQMLTNDDNPEVLSSLHRPVSVQMDDLNNDGNGEIVVCNFGNKIGSLSVYAQANSTQPYKEETLLDVPGAAKCYLEDMDGDGRKDIVSLFSQGDESVYIHYQKDHLRFKARQVLRFPPHYGTTDMVLIDFNHDGLLDIVTAHGDNADYSAVLKAFHGIRIHLNQGGGNFKEAYHYPVYGATRVVADDFDQDGDIDIALTAFFPDYVHLVDESFVYLENTGNDSAIAFTSYTHTSNLAVKSLTLEKGDIDQDGDTDIVLGLFARTPGPVPPQLDSRWKSSKTGLILFLNQFSQVHK